MIDPVSLFLTAFGGAAGKAGATEGQRLVRQLVGLQEAQARLLQAIETKVDALIQGPFHAGHLQLQDALASWRDPDDRKYLLRESRSSFTQALAQDHDPVRSSFAALHLSAIWFALGAPEDVQRSLARAHNYALGGIVPAMGSRGSWNPKSLFDDQFGERERHERGAVVANYANGLARARQQWGATSSEAPIFTGERHHAHKSFLHWAAVIEEPALPDPAAEQEVVDGPSYRLIDGRITNMGDLYGWTYDHQMPSARPLNSWD